MEEPDAGEVDVAALEAVHNPAQGVGAQPFVVREADGDGAAAQPVVEGEGEALLGAVPEDISIYLLLFLC